MTAKGNRSLRRARQRFLVQSRWYAVGIAGYLTVAGK